MQVPDSFLYSNDVAPPVPVPVPVPVADWLTLPERGRRGAAKLTALVGLVGHNHTFVYFSLVLLLAVHAALFLGDLRRLAWDMGAAVLVALAPAAYWAPTWLARGEFEFGAQTFPLWAGFVRLVLPANVFQLNGGMPVAFDTIGGLQAVPMVPVLCLGVRGASCGRDDYLGRLSLGLAMGMGLLALALQPAKGSGFLGPVPWRLGHFVSVGTVLCAVAAAPDLGRALTRLPAIWRAASTGRAAVAAVAVATPLWLRVKARAAAESSEMQQLWARLHDAGPSIACRVVLQDSFGSRLRTWGLLRSHALAFTPTRTALHTVGGWYGELPFRTNRWNLTERRLSDGRGWQDEVKAYAGFGLMRKLGYSEVAFSGVRPLAAAPIAGLLSSWRGERVPWLQLDRPGASVGPFDDTAVESLAWTSRWNKMAATVESAPGPADVALAWHPFRRAAGVEADGDSSIAIGGLTNGRYLFSLAFQPPTWPLWPSVLLILAWLGIALTAAARPFGQRANQG